MRIGILTLPLHANYGGILQAYALQTVLERMNHEVIVIGKQRFPQPYSWYRVLFYFGIRTIKSILKRKRYRYYNINKELLAPYEWINITESNTQKFIKKYIKQTLYTNIETEICLENFDAIVVGSDQVWRPKFFKCFWPLSNAFLSFLKDDTRIKRIAYAVSFGTDNIEYSTEEIAQCSKLIKKFDSVSCREEGGVILAKSLFGINAEHVMDPTMLLEKSDYLNLIGINSSVERNSIAVYFLNYNKDKERLATCISNVMHLDLLEINSKYEILDAPLKDRIQPPVENWLEAFRSMRMIITDSFHACIFSIIFNKPFWVVLNVDGDETRFVSLLKKFSLEHRLINVNNFDVKWDESIDWNQVNELLSFYKKQSLNFLLQSLHL